jgi:hypothetical protein
VKGQTLGRYCVVTAATGSAVTITTASATATATTRQLALIVRLRERHRFNNEWIQIVFVTHYRGFVAAQLGVRGEVVEVERGGGGAGSVADADDAAC